MRCALSLALVAAVWCAASVRTARAEDADVDPQKVSRAIDRAINYIRQQQKPDGSWTEQIGFPGGVTSLCTLALIEAGVPTKDPSIQNALKNIRLVAPERTYNVALQTMALARAGDPADRFILQRNVQSLERTQQQEGPGRGGWGYPNEAGGRVDNSNTQFAILALYEAEQAGAQVNVETWKQALLYWERTKNGRGSWGYVTGTESTGSMTSAGISSIVIASGSVNPADARWDNGGCHCAPHQRNETLESALEWLGEHFSVKRNPELVLNRLGQGNRNIWHYYYLYGVERAGRLTARRFLIGPARLGHPQHDWYREGAAYLSETQTPAGSWIGEGPGETMEHVSTAMALLFLSKGRRPVLISKLQRSGDDWNLLRHDLAHITAYAEKKWKMPMTWQIIDGSTAGLSDYYQTPVLYISGRDPIRFANDAQKQLLRAYVEEGGFIFADASCGGEAFAESFKELMREIFPEPQLAPKPLPLDHPIWSLEERVDVKYFDPKTRWLWGIDVGCRTSVVLSTANLSCYWELDHGRPAANKLPPAAAGELAACRAVGINVLAYATNRQLKKKDEIPREIKLTDTKIRSPRGHLAVAKLRHSGGCDDAPRALANLMEAIAQSLQMRVDAKPPLLDITDKSLFNYHLVFMHGRHDFQLSDKEVEQLQAFVKRGGLIFADSLCASTEFAEAFRREMQRVVPNQPIKQIPPDDPIFSRAFGGEDVTKVTRREAIRHRQGEPLEMKLRENVEPVLEGAKVGNHYAIIFSPYDISCALERHAAPQCRGYTPNDAARLAINVILYSLHE